MYQRCHVAHKHRLESILGTVGTNSSSVSKEVEGADLLLFPFALGHGGSIKGKLHQVLLSWQVTLKVQIVDRSWIAFYKLSKGHHLDGSTF
ncbi:hypothetical protein QOT17_014846 [Balamuthia mandrillaris]